MTLGEPVCNLCKCPISDGCDPNCPDAMWDQINRLKKELKQANLNFQRMCDKLGAANRRHAKKHRVISVMKRLLWKL